MTDSRLEQIKERHARRLGTQQNGFLHGTQYAYDIAYLLEKLEEAQNKLELVTTTTEMLGEIAETNRHNAGTSGDNEVRRKFLDTRADALDYAVSFLKVDLA